MRSLAAFAVMSLLSFGFAGLGVAGVLADNDAAAGAPDSPRGVIADISGDPDQPRRHFRVRDPGRIGGFEAEAIYRGLAADMAKIYALSGAPIAAAYQGWRRYNSAPYLSVTHGQRYVNNYANRLARDYGRFEDAGRMPVGAVIAKDSIAITAGGEAFPGPLFVMEKMAQGFSYASGDWRYTMIMPDGSLLGVTKGEGAQRVEFCIGCHLAREAYDHLYFPPEEVRSVP